MWSNVRRYARISRGRRGLLCEALAALAIARLGMAFVPFRRIALWLGTPGAETPAAVTAEEIRVAEEIGWAVAVLGRRVPWNGRCMAQALAAGGMLRRRGLEGTVSFGACKNQSAGFDAHAWLRLGSLIVTGAPHHEQFKTFTTFARREH